jgi:predicted transposase/invertase (TIGR01784 family)
MQCGRQSYYEKRALFYWSDIYQHQLDRVFPNNENETKKTYKDLKKTVAIHVLDFILYQNTPGFHSHLVMTDKKHGHIQRCQDIEIHVIELPKMQKTCYDNLDKLEQWSLFIKDQKENTLGELAMQDKFIAQAIHDLEILSQDPEARGRYEAKWKYIMDYNSNVEFARESGLAEGKAEGEAKGEAKGKAEAKIEIAKRLKSLHVPISTIALSSGLSEEEIQKL